MTPDFEELRMLARWSGDDPEALAAAAADALVSFAVDPAGLVVACRRLVGHNRAVAPVWWVAASVLTSDDPAGAAGECARRLEQAPTLHALVDAAHGDPSDDVAGLSPILVEVEATDGAAALLTGAAVSLLDAEERTAPVWAVVRVGRYLPGELFRAMCETLAPSPGDAAGPTLRELDGFAAVVGPRGRGTAERALGRPLCGAPPELLRPFT
ncbi:MAG: hypothetical protein R3A49_02550 [Acidimicrobiia bacterium]